MASRTAQQQQNSSQRVDFNSIPPPANYVPGLGRGATGFTTRSDIGPARMAPTIGDPPIGASDGTMRPPQVNDEDADDYDDSKFDEFMGNDAGALANWGEYDDDDREADEIWSSVDRYMDDRRRERREKRLKEQIEKFRADNPKITEQFADLKRKLEHVRYEEWEKIPDIGDYTIKKRPKREAFAPVPDTLLQKAMAEQQSVNKISDGLETPATKGGTATDLTAVGEGRGKMMELRLDRMADSVTGQTVVDPQGYLTSLKSMRVSSETEISDLKKARELLKSVIQTNPKHAPGWIAASRIEEYAGRLAVARELIMKGCENCPNSDDIWLEATRLHGKDVARSIITRAVKENPQSVNLWLQAARLEEEDVQKRSLVLRKALESVPTSVRLWKALVDASNEEDARLLLGRAVECCPQHYELWLALAHLETYENAKKVLNRGRKVIPTEPAIWIAAAKLEESQGHDRMVDMIIQRGIKSLTQNGVVVDRDAWLKEAEGAEKLDPPMVATCRAIVHHVIGLGVEEQDRRHTWLQDADGVRRNGSIETSRAIYMHALDVFPTKESIWREAAALEREHGTRESLDELLKEAVRHCPDAEVLWLMAAKEKWLAGDVPAARQILEEAFKVNSDSEEIWLAAFKVEFKNKEPERAKVILSKARDTPTGQSSQRIWMKSAMVERELGNLTEQRKILEEGIKRFPTFYKLWLMLGQLERQGGNIDAARKAYNTGLSKCKDSVGLWCELAKLEEGEGNIGKARAVLDRSRIVNKNNQELWLAAVRLERRIGNITEAINKLAVALKECTTDDGGAGKLWAEAIDIAPRHEKKSKSTDAIRACDNHPYVVCSVARFFWGLGKHEKARTWFNRAVTLDKDVGDFWAYFYKFELQHGEEGNAKEILRRAKESDPHHGERWCRVAKALEHAHSSFEQIMKAVLVDIDSLPPP